MKKLILKILLVFVTNVFSQTFTTNAKPVGMEHNVLFNAITRFQVTLTGNGGFDINPLFDGKFEPAYSSIAPTSGNPYVILIENLPAKHTQRGAWVGWSTRFWPAKNFKIEGFNEHLSYNSWITIADYENQDNSDLHFIQEVPSGVYTKLRFTFYPSDEVHGNIGVSELFFIHPEAVSPYEGLLETHSANSWKTNGTGIGYTNGNVGIGTTTPDSKLAVNGKIHTKEVKVDLTGWSDFVFEETYKLPTLEEVEKHIKDKGHLKDIPSAKDVAKNGIFLGEMNKKLLQKIEELTLYIIKQQKQFNGQSIKFEKLAEENRELKIINSRLKNVEKRLNELEKK